MQVNAILNATSQGGKKINTTISYLRQSQKSKAEQLATALNALTRNTYNSVQINEINVDPTSSQNLPQEISVTWTGSAQSGITYTVHRLGTGTIAVYYNGTAVTVDQQTGEFQYNASNGPFMILVDADSTYAKGYYIYTRS